MLSLTRIAAGFLACVSFVAFASTSAPPLPLGGESYSLQPEAELGEPGPGDGAYEDYLGWSVAVSGDTLFAGAPDDDIGNVDGVGSVYVFGRTGNTWTQRTKLVPPGLPGGAHLGYAMAVSGTTLAVAAPYDQGLGAVYVFELVAGDWQFRQRLAPAAPPPAEFVGHALAIDGDTIVFGTGEPNISGRCGEAAYVFRREAGVWTESARLVSPSGSSPTCFGFSVAVSGDRIAVGAPFTQVAGVTRGAVEVFERNGSTWTAVQTLSASSGQAGDHFGHSVSLVADTLAIGAPASFSGPGSTYVFVRGGASWTQGPRLQGGGVENDRFGQIVRLAGGRLYVGMPLAQPSGGIAIFAGGGTSWTRQGTATRNLPQDRGSLGQFFASDGVTIAAGLVRDSPDGVYSQGAVALFLGASGLPSGNLSAGAGVQGRGYGSALAIAGINLAVGEPNASAPGIVASLESGAVDVYERSVSGWNRITRLVAPTTQQYARFGDCTAFVGADLLVTAPRYDSGGRAWVYRRVGNSWNLAQELVAPDRQAELGFKCAGSGDTIAMSESSSAVVVFRRVAGNWEFEERLRDPDFPGVRFGSELAVGPDTLAVGGQRNSPTRPVVTMFQRAAGVWSTAGSLSGQQATGSYDYFGYAIALAGDRLAVGAPSPSSSNAGRVDVFERVAGGAWQPRGFFRPASSVAGDSFGNWMARDGALIAVYGGGGTYLLEDDGVALLERVHSPQLQGYPALSAGRLAIGDPGATGTATTSNPSEGRVHVLRISSGLFQDGFE